MITSASMKGGSLKMWFQRTFPLVIWYSLLFNPVTEVELHENHLHDSVSHGALTENESNTEMKEGSALNKQRVKVPSLQSKSTTSAKCQILTDKD